jgi:phage gp46-like protein
MSDIRLVQDLNFPEHSSVTLDWFLRSDGTLDDSQALASAVMVALGTDALASRDDILPDPDSSDRAGWWADLDAEEIWRGWPIGCKLWLLKRDKIVGSAAFQGSTLVRVEQYIRQALQPFVDLRICSDFDVVVTRPTNVDRNRIDAFIRIYRGPQIEVELRYQILWSEVGVNRPYEIGYR